jgi:hypothetical protein
MANGASEWQDICRRLLHDRGNESAAAECCEALPAPAVPSARRADKHRGVLLSERIDRE